MELLYLLPLEADPQCSSLTSGTTLHILLNTPYTVEKQCPQSVYRIPAAVMRSEVLIVVLLRIQVKIQLRNVCRVKHFCKIYLFNYWKIRRLNTTIPEHKDIYFIHHISPN